MLTADRYQIQALDALADAVCVRFHLLEQWQDAQQNLNFVMYCAAFFERRGVVLCADICIAAVALFAAVCAGCAGAA